MTRYTSAFRQHGLTPDEIPQFSSGQTPQSDEKLSFKTGRRKTDQKTNDNQVKKFEKEYANYIAKKDHLKPLAV